MKATFKGVVTIVAAALAGQVAAQITFYEREGFVGDSFTTRRQIGDFARFGFNDSASSVVVGGEPGERWQVCEDVRFNGRCAILRPGRYATLREIGLNNRISSVQAVARVDILPVPATPPAAVGRIVFYEKESFGGRSLTVQEDMGDLRRSGFNDRISSVQVFGAPWEICRGSDFGGPCVVLRAGPYPALSAMGMDNSITSVREVVRDNGPGSAPARVVFYGREGFAGRSFAIDRELPDFSRAGFNDRVSSLQVYGGPWELCRDGGFAGPCVVLRQGSYPSLASMGLDNQISSAHIVGRDLHGADNHAARLPARPIYDPRRRDGERLYEAEVTAVRAVVQTPDRRCWVERDKVVQERGRSNVPGAILGAVIGGILGHQVGDGRGRDLATVGGAVAGGAIGASVGRAGQSQTQDVERCASTPPEVRADLWDVTYQFRGQEHRVQMTSEPGATITVNQDGEPRV